MFFFAVDAVRPPVNRLTNKTLKKLVSCLQYQNYMLLDDVTRGLLYVFLEVTIFISALRRSDSRNVHDVKLSTRFLLLAGQNSNIEKNEDWTMFQELLRLRHHPSDLVDEEMFKDIVPRESTILRRHISGNDRLRTSCRSTFRYLQFPTFSLQSL